MKGDDLRKHIRQQEATLSTAGAHHLSFVRPGDSKLDSET